MLRAGTDAPTLEPPTAEAPLLPLDQTHWGEALQEMRRLRPQGVIPVPPLLQTEMPLGR